MPEGVEVKCTTDFLKELEGQSILSWQFSNEKFTFGGYAESVKNAEIEEIWCKGKTIFFSLYKERSDKSSIKTTEGEKFYCVHTMRLSGSWSKSSNKYTICTITTENGTFYYRDPRKFGTFEFVNEEEVNRVIDGLGVDIFSTDFKLRMLFILTAQHRNKNITSFLMNQNIISGIGNYLKAEILYAAKLSPLRKVGSLSFDEIERLYGAILDISSQSYQKG
jgi:formamidopyrimidine-DNA glycosylase